MDLFAFVFQLVGLGVGGFEARPVLVFVLEGRLPGRRFQLRQPHLDRRRRGDAAQLAGERRVHRVTGDEPRPHLREKVVPREDVARFYLTLGPDDDADDVLIGGEGGECLLVGGDLLLELGVAVGRRQRVGGVDVARRRVDLGDLGPNLALVVFPLGGAADAERGSAGERIAVP